MSVNVAGRLALDFAGIPIDVMLYGRVKKTRNDSFKTIAPSGEVAESGKMIDTGTGKPFDGDKKRKGVLIKSGERKGEYAILTEEAIEQIGSCHKTKHAEPDSFVPYDSIAWDLAIDRFAVRPDDKKPGSETNLQVLWNGLHANALAYTTVVNLRGSSDAILAVYASDNGLWAALLPFEDELYDVPTASFVENGQMVHAFSQALEQLVADGKYKVGRFDHRSYVSEYRTKRKAAIDAVIAGEKIEVDSTPAQTGSAPDLMAVLAAIAKPTETREKIAA